MKSQNKGDSPGVQGKTSKGWRKSIQEEEPDKCKSKSSEQEVVFKLQWKKKPTRVTEDKQQPKYMEKENTLLVTFCTP